MGSETCVCCYWKMLCCRTWSCIELFVVFPGEFKERFFLFYTMTNKSTIILQIITLLHALGFCDRAS